MRPLSRVAQRLHPLGLDGGNMLFIVFLLLALWFFGFMTSATLGGTLNILLVIAIVLFLIHIIQGRSVGNA
jgi:Family of unknown function (DUF5670)